MTKATVVYYSTFGNTEKVAKALAVGLQSEGVNVNVVNVEEVKPDELAKVDLLCVGSPVHGWSPSKPIKEFLEHLQSVSGLGGKKAFAFDTKMKSRLAGSAGGKIEKKLNAIGFTVVRHSVSAIVEGREGPLEQNAEEEFKMIGIELGKLIQQSP